ncbi:MAG: hypothetical protein DRP87_00965 [Spirochaetes bacterium]|nr:MAG: hypothetical protein DRP87_00965 [Spirochaetota bacterium]
MKPRFFCDNCGKEVPFKAEKCPACGKYFELTRCPECGFSGKQDLFFSGCPACGYLGVPSYHLQKRKEESKSHLSAPVEIQKESTKSLPLWFYLFSILILSGAIILFFILLLN